MAMWCLLPQARRVTLSSLLHQTTSSCDTPQVIIMASTSQQITEPLSIAIQEQSAFLSRLPPKLRLIMYHFHILDSPSPSPSNPSESSAKSTYYEPTRFRKLSPPLAQTCRHTAHEMAPMMSRYFSITVDANPVQVTHRDP